MNARGTFAATLTGLLVATAGSCGEQPTKEFAGKTIAAGETLLERWDLGATRPISVYVPTGILHLRLDEQTDYLDDDSEHTFADVRAADGAELVGIEWELEDTSAYPTEVGEALIAVSSADQTKLALQGDLPAVIDLAVDADGHRIDIPALTETKDRSGHVVVGVPEGSTPTFEVTFDGHTQVVDLATGEVAAGRAVPLAVLAGALPSGTDSWQFGERVRCSDEGQPELIEAGFACGASLALELPYVRGLGWAEPAKPYVMVELSMSVAGISQAGAGLPALAVTLDGGKVVKTIDYGLGDIRVFTAKPNSFHELRIKGDLTPSAGGASVDKELQIQTWHAP